MRLKYIKSERKRAQNERSESQKIENRGNMYIIRTKRAQTSADLRLKYIKSERKRAQNERKNCLEKSLVNKASANERRFEGKLYKKRAQTSARRRNIHGTRDIASIIINKNIFVDNQFNLYRCQSCVKSKINL